MITRLSELLLLILLSCCHMQHFFPVLHTHIILVRNIVYVMFSRGCWLKMNYLVVFIILLF